MTAVDGLVGSVAGWASLALAGYLALGVVVALVAQRQAALSGWADRVLLLYPRVARLAVRSVAAAAVGLAVTPASALAAEQGGGGAPRPPVVAPLHPSAEPLDWPTAGAAAHLAAPTVTVDAGDCLWSIAARAIGPDAPPREVAAAWPRWWAANRAVIGSDPDLLRPGLHLRAPVSVERNAS